MNEALETISVKRKVLFGALWSRKFSNYKLRDKKRQKRDECKKKKPLRQNSSYRMRYVLVVVRRKGFYPSAPKLTSFYRHQSQTPSKNYNSS